MSDTTGVFTPEANPLTTEREAEIHRTLDVLWCDAPGVLSWLRSVDHKSIAKRYGATAFVFFLLGGVNALFMRMQLARPSNALLGPERYNQLFSMHGTTMMFLFAVRVMIALGLDLVPPMLGRRDAAF